MNLTLDHPDDRAARTRLVTTLTDLRRRRGLTATRAARLLGVTFDAVTKWETHPAHNPRIPAAQARAWLVGHQIRLEVVDLPDTSGDPTVAVLTALGRPHDPDQAHAYDVDLLRAHLVAAANLLDVSNATVAARCGLTRDAVGRIRRGSSWSEPKLATPQLIARALGGHLTVTLTPTTTE